MSIKSKTAAFSAVLTGAVLLCATIASSAHAIPFQFSYTGTTTSGNIPGVTNGDTISINVIADNGGGSAISQTWNVVDLISADVSVGTYSANYTADFFNNDPMFVTDAAGLLITAGFIGTLNSLVNSDVFGTGGSVRLFDSSVQDFNGNLDFYGPILGFSLGGWSQIPTTPTAVPEPGTLALFGLGLAGLGFARRRKAT